MEAKHQEPRTAWKPGTFARAIDKSRSWLYALPPELKPISVKVGRSRLIIEAPEVFVRRLAEQHPTAE